MISNNFLKAIALKLNGIWKDRNVYVNTIPKDIDGNFFINIIESEQEKKLDRRRKKSFQFEILYFLKSDDNMEFNEWVEEMYDNFERLEVILSNDMMHSISLKNINSSRDKNLNAYRFLFDVEFSYLLLPDEVPNMETIKRTEDIK